MNRPGVWEVGILTGSDAHGRPTQVSRTVHGGKREPLRLAARTKVGAGRAHSACRLTGDVLDAWASESPATWAPSSACEGPAPQAGSTRSGAFTTSGIAATGAIAQGQGIRTVAGRVGHANPAMTLSIYAHGFGAADEAVAASLGDALKKRR